MHISRKALVAIYSSIPAPVVGMYVALTLYTALTAGLAAHADILNFPANLGYAAYSAAFIGIAVSGLIAFALYPVIEAIIGPDTTSA